MVEPRRHRGGHGTAGSIPWVRAYGWAGAARGVYGVLEPRTWLNYQDGGRELVGLTLAITVDEVEDFGRDAWVEVRGKRHPLDRYMLRGTIYRLREDDLALVVRPMPAGAVPIEDVLSLPNHVFVAGLAHHSKDEVNAQRSVK